MGEYYMPLAAGTNMKSVACRGGANGATARASTVGGIQGASFR